METQVKKDLNNYNPLKSVKNLSVVSLFSFKMDEKLKLDALLQKAFSFHIPASNTELLDTTDYTCSKLTSRGINAEGTHHISQA